MSKVPLSFPYKLQLAPSVWPRYPIMAAHLLLAINPTTVLFMPLPITGLTFALPFLLWAFFTRTPYSREAVRQAFGRWLLALVLTFAFAVYHAYAVMSGHPSPNLIWLVLIFMQAPLGIYDAREIAAGRIGLRLFRTY